MSLTSGADLAVLGLFHPCIGPKMNSEFVCSQNMLLKKPQNPLLTSAISAEKLTNFENTNRCFGIVIQRIFFHKIWEYPLCYTGSIGKPKFFRTPKDPSTIFLAVRDIFSMKIVKTQTPFFKWFFWEKI